MALVLVAGAAILGCGSADPPNDSPGGQDGTGAPPGAEPNAGPGDQPGAAGSPAAGVPRSERDQAVGNAPELTVYFSRGDSTVAVSRQPAAGRGGLEAALRALLAGPSAGERAAGLHSWFSDTTAGALRSVTLDDEGRALVDFEDLRELIPNASTSAGSAMLLRELNTTVFAVPSVRSVEYRIEGSCEQFWEWLQYGGCPVQERS